MNLQPFFTTQKILDDRIIEEKGLQGQDLLDKDIRALFSELGELSNEERGFKYWSGDQEPNDYNANPDDMCVECKGQPIFYNNIKTKIVGQCKNCDGIGYHYHNPMLEEYADCLSFILTIGNKLNYTDVHITHNTVNKMFGGNEPVDIRFNNLFFFVSRFYEQNSFFWYDTVFESFLALGFALGFTWQEIEDAYYEKNEINHERQANGY